MRADSRTKSRVGIIVFASLVLFAGALMVVGGKMGFFLARTSYFTRFPNSQGLMEGNQVRLAGVTVGAVRKVEVPRQPGQDLTITFDIERRYQHLVKTDSRVEIKTIGLLGDKYLEVTPGSPDKPDLGPDHEIIAYHGAELEKILAGSGDLVDNVVAISQSLKNILGRTERGEGFLGEITSEKGEGEKLSRSLRATIDSANQVLVDIHQGKGLLGRLVGDEALANRITGELESSMASIQRIAATLDKGASEGAGLLPALLNDPSSKKKFYDMVDSLKATADGLASFSRDLDKGKGALPRLVHDEKFGQEFLGDLKSLSRHLDNVAKKLDSTEGTAGKLIADPSVYEAINDVIVGIDQSKLLKWLIRNRQKSGIKKRYEETRAKMEADGQTPPSPDETASPKPTPEPRLE